MPDNNSTQSFLKRVSGKIDEWELEHPTLITPLKLIWQTIRSFFHERPGQIIGSAFLLIMVWGYHGELNLLAKVWPQFKGPGLGWNPADTMRTSLPDRPSLIPGVPYDNELISFWIGAFLLVVIPILLIRFVYHQPLSDYGLGLPPKGRRNLAFMTFLLLMVVLVPAFWVGTADHDMQYVYPIYRPFTGMGQFLLYELLYLPFFIAIEFIFRGYLLFGLAGVRDVELQQTGDRGTPGIFYFHKYALLIQMLSYTAWHLGKPLPELWGTPIWGLAAGATAYAVRSIWPITAAHWLLNVFLDYMVLHRLGLL